MTRTAPERRPLLLLSERFPPDIGGSSVLMANVYSRLGREVTVLTDRTTSPGEDADRGPVRIRHASLATPYRGLLDPRGLPRHARTARLVARLAPGPRSFVHCARALPEGVAASLARLGGGPRYLCWSHGEDVAGAATSRDLLLTMKLVLRRAEAVLANSRNTRTLLEGIGVPPGRIRVAHPGVDVERFHPSVPGEAVRRRYLGDGDLLLLSVGRLQRRKGHDLVLAALAAMGAESSRFRYLIAGAGEEERRLRETARRLGLADRVHFAGCVPDAELPAYYAACDVFVLPNREDGESIEGFGIVFLEAAASAKPVVAGRTGGAPEAVAEGETGILVKGTDVEELRAALRRLAASETLRRRLGEAGRARVVRDFCWERTAVVVSELQAELERRT